MSPLHTDDLSQLAKKALWYAASAGAVLGLSVADVDAQIVYVDIDPDLDVMDTFVGEFAGTGVDFDGDGDAEIEFGERDGDLYTLANVEAVSDGPDGVTGIVGNLILFGDYFAYFVPVNSGVSIGPSNATITGYYFATFTFNGADPNGFIGLGDTYIGVQFSFDGTTTHYAWLRVEMPAGGGRILVKDFAYESTPDTPINAGQIVTAIEPGPDGLPGTHTLSAVFPNPFNPQARFTLEIAEQQDVNIAVFDALGRQVALLHDGALGAGTIHQFRIDGASLASGVYVVRAIGEHFTDVRQVTLTR